MSSSALIVVDMLNPYEHRDAEPLMASVEDILPSLQQLIDEAKARDVKTIYVNDNYGDWSAGRAELMERALAGAVPSLVEPVLPAEDLPFVVKARHSIFYQTPLEYLLREAGIDRIALAGQVTEQCILYSALDAYVRRFEVVVSRDTVAHIHADLGHAALAMMAINMRAEVTSTALQAIDLL